MTEQTNNEEKDADNKSKETETETETEVGGESSASGLPVVKIAVGAAACLILAWIFWPASDPEPIFDPEPEAFVEDPEPPPPVKKVVRKKTVAKQVPPPRPPLAENVEPKAPEPEVSGLDSFLGYDPIPSAENLIPSKDTGRIVSIELFTRGDKRPSSKPRLKDNCYLRERGKPTPDVNTFICGASDGSDYKVIAKIAL